MLRLKYGQLTPIVPFGTIVPVRNMTIVKALLRFWEPRDDLLWPILERVLRVPKAGNLPTDRDDQFQLARSNMTRRQFAFWIGLGLFGLGERLRLSGFDSLAAALLRDPKDDKSESRLLHVGTPEHWVATDDDTNQWYERENFLDNQWKLTGTTTPINKKTGQPVSNKSGYLDDGLVPMDIRASLPPGNVVAGSKPRADFTQAHADPARRARHGRPPSKWLRSLRADELRIWLKTIDVPEAGVSGMTFLTHLTRDHSFDPANVEDLTIPEQAKLHAAAHFGY